MRIRYTRRATQHLLSLYQYIAARNPTAADRVSERIEFTVNFLADFPYAGHVGVRVGTRELRVTDAPYIVVHRIQADDIVLILGAYHTARRRPGQRFR